MVVQKLIEDGAKADLKRWMQAIEITASRAGLLLCADLEIAKKIIARRAAAARRPAAGGQDEGAARLLGERAVLRAPQDARHRGRLTAVVEHSFASTRLRAGRRVDGAWSEGVAACPSPIEEPSPSSTTLEIAASIPPRRRRGSSRCRTRRGRAASRSRRRSWSSGRRRRRTSSCSDATVSSRHCALSVLGGGVAIEDLGSRNGTFVGRARVREAWGRRAPRGHGSLDARRLAARRGRRRRTAGRAARRHRRVRRSRCGASPTRCAGSRGTRCRCSSRARAARARSSSPARSTPRGRGDRVRSWPSTSTALPRELVESELFGHERGAFTGAHVRREGAFAEAEGGTLFLDEIGDLPLEAQPKLLRALDGYEVRRVGGAGSGRRADVRVVAATHAPLEQRVTPGRVPARPLPPARVLRRPRARRCASGAATSAPSRASSCASSRRRSGPRTLTPAALARLAAHDWPGNVRELRNVLCRAADATRRAVSASTRDDVDVRLRRDAARAREVPDARAGRELLREQRREPQRGGSRGGPAAHLVPQAPRRVSRLARRPAPSLMAQCPRVVVRGSTAPMCARALAARCWRCAAPRESSGSSRGPRRIGAAPRVDVDRRAARASATERARPEPPLVSPAGVLGARSPRRAPITRTSWRAWSRPTGVVRVMGLTEGSRRGRSTRSRGVAWAPDAELQLQPAGDGVALVWRGPLGGQDGSDARRPRAARRAARRADRRRRRVRARPPTGSRGSILAASGPAHVRARRWDEADGPRRRRRSPPIATPTLVCGDHDAFVLGDGDDDLTRDRLLSGGGGRSSRASSPIRDRDFGDDDEREHEAFTVGDDLGIVRVGGAGALVDARGPRDGHASPWRRLKRALSEDDDVVAVDGDATSTLVVLHARRGRRVPGQRVGRPDRPRPADRPQDGRRGPADPRAPPTATARRARSGSPHAPGGPLVAWSHRRARPASTAAPIDSLVYRVLQADRAARGSRGRRGRRSRRRRMRRHRLLRGGAGPRAGQRRRPARVHRRSGVSAVGAVRTPSRLGISGRPNAAALRSCRTARARPTEVPTIGVTRGEVEPVEGESPCRSATSQ